MVMPYNRQDNKTSTISTDIQHTIVELYTVLYIHMKIIIVSFQIIPLPLFGIGFDNII